MASKKKIKYEIEEDLKDFKDSTKKKPSRILMRGAIMDDLGLGDRGKVGGVTVIRNNFITTDWRIV